MIQFCQDILLYGFSTFLPSIIESMGYNSLQAQYLTIPVYVVGGGSFLALSFLSDRLTLRSPFIVLSNFIGIIGYALMLSPVANGVKFFGTFLCAIAAYNGPGMNVTWLNVNVAPHHRRAAAIGFQQTMANCAGIVAGQIYRSAPYKLGNAFSLGAAGFAQVMIGMLAYYISRQTRLKEKIAKGEVEDTRKVKTGDRELDFRYHL